MGNCLAESGPVEPFTITGVKCATVVRVIDGDTIEVNMRPYARTKIYTMRIRFDNCNAPETRVGKKNPKRDEIKAAGAATKKFVTGQLPPGKRVMIACRDYDDFGRVLGTVSYSGAYYMDENGQRISDGIVSDLGALLIRKGLAVPYEKKRPTKKN